jgi:hypothetical protein
MTSQTERFGSEDGDIGLMHREKMRALLRAGAQSELGTPVDANHFEMLRNHIHAKANEMRVLKTHDPVTPSRL